MGLGGRLGTSRRKDRKEALGRPTGAKGRGMKKPDLAKKQQAAPMAIMGRESKEQPSAEEDNRPQAGEELGLAVVRWIP